MQNQAPGRKSANNERNRRANFVDNSTTYFDLTFDQVPPANNKLFLYRFGQYLTDKVITGIELLPNITGTNIVNGYNVLRPIDFAQFTLTLRDSQQNIILDGIPFVYFSNIGPLFKNKLFLILGVDMRYSFITYSGLPLATPVPFCVPIIFTYH
jgi:hypothetical protein